MYNSSSFRRPRKDRLAHPDPRGATPARHAFHSSTPRATPLSVLRAPLLQQATHHRPNRPFVFNTLRIALSTTPVFSKTSALPPIFFNFIASFAFFLEYRTSNLEFPATCALFVVAFRSSLFIFNNLRTLFANTGVAPILQGFGSRLLLSPLAMGLGFGAFHFSTVDRQLSSRPRFVVREASARIKSSRRTIWPVPAKNRKRKCYGNEV